MKKKGFTLIELIIVIAIIGVLMGVLIPSWGNYMNRARTRSQNLKAKTIFNAAQTFATDLKFAERKWVNVLQSSASAAEKSNADAQIMGEWKNNSTEWCIYFDGGRVGFCDLNNFSLGYTPKSFDVTTASDNKANNCNLTAEKFHDSIKNIVDGNETIYKIYVKDYKVVSVVSSRFANDRYLGSYPTTLDALEDKGIEGVNISDIRNGKVVGANMYLFALNPIIPTTPDPETP